MTGKNPIRFHFPAPTHPLPADINALAEDEILKMAKDILRRRFTRGTALTSPDTAKDYLIAEFAELEHEIFACLWLDNKHQVIQLETLFHGTIDGATVHPREVVKAALLNNAAAVILAHNHPSGNPQPSSADRKITERLADALKLVEVRVLDHIIVGGAATYAFSEHGLL